MAGGARIEDIESGIVDDGYGTIEGDPISRVPLTENGVILTSDRNGRNGNNGHDDDDGGGDDDHHDDDDDGDRMLMDKNGKGGKTSLRKIFDKWGIRAIYGAVGMIVLVVLVAIVIILIIGNGPPDNRPFYSFDDFIGRKLTPSKFSMQWTRATGKGDRAEEDVFTYWKIGSSNVDKKSVETCVLMLYRAEDGSETEILSHEKRVEMDMTCHTPHELADTKILFKPRAVNVFRHSSKAKFILFDTITGKYRFVSPRTTSENDVRQKLMHWCPDKSKGILAYVENNDLYVQRIHEDETVDDKRITDDGDDETIFNGSTDWLYEEEIFGSVKTFFFNSNCSHIAFLKLNNTNVNVFQYPTYRYSEEDSPYPKNNRIRLPAAGYNNPVPSVHIYDVNNHTTVNMDLGADQDIYIYDLMWQNVNTVAAIRLNRVQQQRDVLMKTVGDDITKTLQKMKTSTWFEYRQSLFFLPMEDGRYFVDIMPNAEAKYHYNVALFDSDKKEDDKFSKWLVQGEYDVTHIFKTFNSESSEIYYQSTERNSTDRHILAVNVKTGNVRNLTSIEEDAYFDASFSPSGKHAMFYYEGPDVPTSILVKTVDPDSDGNRIVFEDNKNLKEDLDKYRLPQIELTTIKNRVGDDLNAIIMYPPGFTTNIAYPVLMYQYSGPGSQMVNNGFRAMHHAYSMYVASEGFIVVIADGRGTGFRGEKFMTQTYLRLGKLETEDQIDVAKYLQSLPYVDATRIALWGWSYGGYMTLNAITSAENDNVFRLGMSVAPVTNWRYYDSGYTERYMSLPELNQQNYFNTSIFSQLVDPSKKCLDNIAIGVGEGLTELLLVHGTGDDNVHMLNSYNIMTQMQNCGVQFDVMPYADKDHSIQGAHTTPHLYRMLSNKLFSIRN